ncbi:hypothetical protein [Siccirubricoccus deserti]|uniref:Uncharacterized protein n=1 Tax=Siccirubricoccus deserti TaxID=2013562 RepID=A0A9X0UGF4_9PROT|nr:hypothetical protein [Siccirubricoccus deserti]MBC4015265.1 hypothetical protein [Siccirubricoccus deserti]
MTRRQALAAYRPIRAGIQDVLRLAVKACTKADLTRALRQLLPGADAFPDDDQALEMLMDVALFEPNQRGRRAYDGFLAKGAAALDAPDRALAEAMAGARFSLFRVAGRHPAAGIWAEDLLAGDARLWLMDKGLEASAPEDAVFGMRLFDAGPFHAGFGIIVPVDEFTLSTARAAAERGNPLPFRQSLAATLYGDVLRETLPPDEELLDMLEDLLSRAEAAGARPSTPPAPPRSAPPGPAARRSPRPPALPRRRG